MRRLTHAALLDRSRLQAALEQHTDGARLIRILRTALAHGRRQLIEQHLHGGSAAALVKHHSWLIDQILRLGWQRSAQSHAVLEQAALIATGGYGRSQLNLGSDIDLLLLLPAPAERTLWPATEDFVRLCWDLGIKVSHSLRQIQPCIALAKTDITVMTSLMEARLISGSEALFVEFQRCIRHPRLWPADTYFESKLAEQAERHLHFGDTAYNLEPNLKETPGGLRDLHMIGWVANRHFGTSDLAELVQHAFLARNEFRALITGRDFLWRLRNGLHILSDRCEDRLLFDYQTELAHQLGYRAGENHLAVEQMMKRYYRTVKELQLLNELLLQHFREAILVRRQAPPKKINPRFQAVGKFIEAANRQVFTDTPAALLELFHILQLNPKLQGVRASTIRQLRARLPIIDSAYRRNPAHCRLFLEIFRQPHLYPALQRMNAYGVLGRFFPEFGRIVGQMQHDLFHVYTVDAHSLFVVGNLCRLMLPQYRHEFPLLSDLLSRQNKRERIYLAALCHDIGKGSGKDHSRVGEQIAYRLCLRLCLSEYDAALVAWLVRHHLILSRTAQHEDISDPQVIERFAQTVGDQERLDSLYLLTFADMRGTNPKVWNEWKGQLLASLFTATSRRLRSGISGAPALQTRIDARKREIKALVKNRLSEPALEQFWSILDAEYFLRNGPETSAWQAIQISRAKLLEVPLVTARYRPAIKAQEILLMAPESEDLLLGITGGLDKLNLHVMDARIHQAKSGMALLVFIVADPDGRAANKHWLKQNTDTLRAFLLSNPNQYQPAKRIVPRTIKQFRVPTEVTFGRPNGLNHTPMEVVSQDRTGLLYHVARALRECKVKLISAKVSTVGEKAEDTFFITDRDNKPVAATSQREQLQSRLKAYLTPSGPAAPPSAAEKPSRMDAGAHEH